ncbi:SGNH/GDSL hydrolase family protein [Bartonella sp. B35(2025)]
MSYFHPIYFTFLFFSTFILIVIQQTPSKAENFFELLFKYKKQEQQPKIYKLQKKTIRPKPAQKLKKENAKRILVIGDFVASAAANELKNFFTDNDNIVIINNAVPSSGLVRTDYYSWKNNTSKLIDKNKPDAIVMIIGANDNQPITTPHGILSTSQPEWINIYKKKVTEMAEILHDSGKPWIWMGQPSFENNNLTQKMRIFNELYKNATEAAKGYFIDIWSDFTDTQGQFSFSGYDINGKIVRLRTADGINFTSEGKQKLASYFKSKLEIILNFHLPSHENIHSTNTETLKLIQKSNNITHQPPMSLDDMAQQNTYLLDKMDPSFIQKSWSPSNGYQIDRADNFSFP